MARKILLSNKTCLGILISKKLIEIGMTEKELSLQLGKCHKYVYLLMRGRYKPPLKVISDISKILDIGIDELTQAVLKDEK